MRFFLSTIAIGVLLLPISVSAAGECSADGYTVVFVNGVGNTEAEARASQELLEKVFRDETGRTDVEFLLGYNPSHYAAGGDLVKSGVQIRSSAGNAVQDHDLIQILNDLEPKIQTQRLALVGHSQGTFYTNAMHEYLGENGIPPASLGIYNIATPAQYVAGGGPYLTSSNDGIITSYVEFAAKWTLAPRPLPANIMIPLDQAVDPDGHSFPKTYLPGASRTLLGTLSSQLASLATFPSREDRDCYTPPPQGFIYTAKDVVYGVSDPVIGFAVDTGGRAVGLVVDTVKLAASLAVSAGNVLVDAATTLWGWGGAALAQVQSLFDSDNELMQAGLFALLPFEGQTDWPLQEPPAASPNPPPAGEVLGETTLPQPGPRAPLPPAASLPPAFSLPPAENIANPPIEEPIGPPETPTVEPGPSEEPQPEPGPEPPAEPPAPPPSPPGGGGSGPPPPFEPPLAHVRINEVAWAGTVASGTHEWLELRNEEDAEVDLAGWTLVGYDENDPEDSPGVEIPLSHTIAIGGLFLIERTDDTRVADVSADITAPFGDSLNNTGERLELRDNLGRLVDFVEPVRDPETGTPTGWLAGDLNTKASMARDVDGEWFTSVTPTCPAHDADGKAIVGTPRAANDAIEVVACPPPPVSVLLTIAEEAAGMRLQYPDITKGEERFLVTWGDAAEGTARVWAQPIANDGALLGPSWLLSEGPGADPPVTRVAFQDGVFLVSWGTGGLGGKVIGVRIQEDGAVLDTEPVVLFNADSGDTARPEVVVPFGDDAFLVFLQRTDRVGSVTVPAHGVPLLPEALTYHDILGVSSLVGVNGATCRGTMCLLAWTTGYGVRSVAIDTTAINWNQGGCLNFFDACAGTLLAALEGGIGEQTFSLSYRGVVVTPDDGFLLVWSRDARSEVGVMETTLFAQRFDGAGATAGEPVAVSATGLRIAAPFLAARDDGTFLLTSVSAFALANALQGTLTSAPALLGELTAVTAEPALTLNFAPAACLGARCAHAWLVWADAFSPAAMKVFVGE